MSTRVLGSFDSRLSVEESGLRAFRTLLRLDGVVVFSCEDFYRYGLERFVSGSIRDVEGWFAKLQSSGVIVSVGNRLVSSLGRVVQTYRWESTLQQARVNCYQDSPSGDCSRVTCRNPNCAGLWCSPLKNVRVLPEVSCVEAV